MFKKRPFYYGIAAGALVVYLYAFYGADFQSFVDVLFDWKDSATDGAGSWN